MASSATLGKNGFSVGCMSGQGSLTMANNGWSPTPTATTRNRSLLDVGPAFLEVARPSRVWKVASRR